MFKWQQNVKIIFIFIAYLNLCGGELREGEICRSDDGLSLGKCTSFLDCENAIELVDSEIPPTFCNPGFELHFNPLVCCFDSSNLGMEVRQRISLEMCKKYSNKVYKPTMRYGESYDLEPYVTHNIRARKADELELIELEYDETVTARTIEVIEEFQTMAPETVTARTIEVIEEFQTMAPVDKALHNAKYSYAMEFPHMALLGVGNYYYDFRWICGGSLISEKFVLTAAHCIHNDIGPIRWVRLGELDTKDAMDNADPQDFSVLRAISHPNYQTIIYYHDIGLLELDSPVKFTAHIKPACLYQNSDISSIESAVATGWGKISYNGRPSSHLLKATLNLVNNTRCNEIYQQSRFFEEKLPYKIIDSVHICAGGNEEKSHCEGDSGGPLQIERDRNQYDIIGVIAFGLPCGSLDVPSVFTRVDFYLDWIEQVVWP